MPPYGGSGAAQPPLSSGLLNGGVWKIHCVCSDPPDPAKQAFYRFSIICYSMNISYNYTHDLFFHDVSYQSYGCIYHVSFIIHHQFHFFLIFFILCLLFFNFRNQLLYFIGFFTVQFIFHIIKKIRDIH